MAEDNTPTTRTLQRLLSLPTLSLLVASLSLAASISQNYNYQRSIEAVQRNVLRTDNLRACREIIEVFFAYRLRAQEANVLANAPAGARPDEKQAARRDLKSLTSRFGALGTHLANFTPDGMRERYTALYRSLDALSDSAASLAAPEFAPRLAEADAAFGTLNEDCVRTAQFPKS